MADTPWAGRAGEKLYLTSGQFTSTIKTSESIGAVDASLQDISYDGTNTPWTGAVDDKLYLTSGQFTSTIKTSESINAVDATPTGISYDGTNTPWCGANDVKLYLTSGQFSSTIKTSQSVSAVDTGPQDISYDGTNTPWCGSQAQKLYLQSGQFTSTIKTSELVSGVDTNPQGISWDGTNTPWAGSEADKLYLTSGQFTSTIKTSEDVSGVDANPIGIDTNDVNARLGVVASTGDVAITLPQFTVQGGSGATGVITLPLLSVQGLGAATGVITLPQFNVQGASGTGAELTLPLLSLSASDVPPATATLTLPLLTLDATALQGEVGNFAEALVVLSTSFIVQATRGFHGLIQITLPKFASGFTALQGSVDGTTINLPAFTINIRTGLTPSTVLPQLSLAATGHPGHIGIFNKSLPRMIVNVKATAEVRGEFNITLPAFTLDNSLLTGNISLPSTRNLPVFNLNAHGFRGENGDGAVTFPAFTLTTESYQSLNGTVVQSLKMLTLDAYADVYTNRII